jgi:hypothetical protein
MHMQELVDKVVMNLLQTLKLFSKNKCTMSIIKVYFYIFKLTKMVKNKLLFLLEFLNNKEILPLYIKIKLLILCPKIM